MLLGIYKPTEGSISFRAGEATSIRGNVSAFNEDIKNGFKGRREIFTNEYNYILVTDSNKTQYKMKTLENDSVYYAKKGIIICVE